MTGDILTLLRGAGIRLFEVDGTRYRLACPFPEHEDSHPSAVAFTDTNHVWCSTCQRRAYLEELAAILGQPWTPRREAEIRPMWRPRRPLPLPESEVTAWRTYLQEAAVAADSGALRRDGRYREAFRLLRKRGVAWALELHEVLMPLPELHPLIPSRWLGRPERGSERRLITPLYDLVTAAPVSVQGRLTDPEPATSKKVLFPPGARVRGSAFLNRHARRAVRATVPTDYAVMTEGDVDFLSAVVAFQGPVFGAPGAGMLPKLVGDWCGRGTVVLLAVDNDPAGRTGARRCAQEIQNRGGEPRFLGLPAGEDLNDQLMARGREWLCDEIERHDPINHQGGGVVGSAGAALRFLREVDFKRISGISVAFQGKQPKRSIGPPADIGVTQGVAIDLRRDGALCRTSLHPDKVRHFSVTYCAHRGLRRIFEGRDATFGRKGLQWKYLGQRKIRIKSCKLLYVQGLRRIHEISGGTDIVQPISRAMRPAQKKGKRFDSGELRVTTMRFERARLDLPGALERPYPCGIRVASTWAEHPFEVLMFATAICRRWHCHHCWSLQRAMFQLAYGRLFEGAFFGFVPQEVVSRKRGDLAGRFDHWRRRSGKPRYRWFSVSGNFAALFCSSDLPAFLFPSTDPEAGEAGSVRLRGRELMGVLFRVLCDLRIESWGGRVTGGNWKAEELQHQETDAVAVAIGSKRLTEVHQRALFSSWIEGATKGTTAVSNPEELESFEAKPKPEITGLAEGRVLG